MRLPRPRLLGKIWLSTSVAITLLFAVAGYVVQRRSVEATSRTLDDEVRASFRAYESLWKARADKLSAVAAIMSSMPNVRSAFGTRDPATIRDTAAEVWGKLTADLRENGFLLVVSPDGRPVASLSGAPPASEWPVVRAARRFPQQVSGFHVEDGALYQLVLTPVYVDAVNGPALLNVLVAGYPVDHGVAAQLKRSTGGSEFVFTTQGRVAASTLAPGAAVDNGAFKRVDRVLMDVEGRPIATLSILRSFASARQHLAALRRDVVLLWLAAVVAGLALTYVLVRKIVGPVKELDRAAAEVARQNYSYRIQANGDDELGRLATTFNTMCASLQSARAELIRQERISTVGRLASSIVHDLRNPLAAIYGGAEILVDTDLPAAQMKRLAGNIYQASRRVSAMLEDLANVARGKTEEREPRRLLDVVLGAVDAHEAAARACRVEMAVDVPEHIELLLQHGRIERVFSNLIGNALDVMPEGGEIRIAARAADDRVLVSVDDTGPGIAPKIRDQIFQPFVTYGKRNGLGLGLALARQAVVEHGGEIWVDRHKTEGARFVLSFPYAGAPAPVDQPQPAA